jgi:hypothetical protein
MRNNGYRANVGDTIPYAMANSKAQNAEQKAKHPSQVDCVAECDSQWYLEKQVQNPLERLLEQFSGISKRQIEGVLAVPKITSRSPIREFTYSCLNCKAKYNLGSMVFVCGKCKLAFNWKYICNSLTIYIGTLFQQFSTGNQLSCNACEFRGSQLPVSATSHLWKSRQTCEMQLNFAHQALEFYRTLKTLSAQCEKPQEPTRGYLKGIIIERLKLHGLNRIRLSTLLAVSPWQAV